MARVRSTTRILVSNYHYRHFIYIPLSFTQIIGSHIRIHGHMRFSKNNGLGLDGGALYVTSLGQLELFAGADMVFQGNKGV